MIYLYIYIALFLGTFSLAIYQNNKKVKNEPDRIYSSILDVKTKEPIWQTILFSAIVAPVIPILGIYALIYKAYYKNRPRTISKKLRQYIKKDTMLEKDGSLYTQVKQKIRYSSDESKEHPSGKELNIWQQVTQKEGSFFGVYYFSVEGLLFYLDLRVSIAKNHDKYFHVWAKVFHYDENNECFRFDVEAQMHKYHNTAGMQGIIQAAEKVVVNEATYFYEELMRIKNGREYLKYDDWNNLHIESYTTIPKPDSSHQLDWKWEDIAKCGKIAKRRWRLQETCPECNTRLIEVYMSSSATSWHEFAGIAGMLTFCPHCQKQLRFNLETMN